MKRAFSIEAKVLPGILLAIIIMVGMGIFTYKSMTNIANCLNDADKPDYKLILIKEISSDLTNAGSSIKTFSLTMDTSYLPPFYKAASSISKEMDSLYYLSKHETNPLIGKITIDSIRSWIEDKFFILNQFLIIKNDDNLRNEKIHTLTRRDKIIMDKIQFAITRLETQERLAIETKAQEAEKMSSSAHTMITLFCIVASILMLVVAYVILNYIQTNKAYNKALRNAKTQAENLAKAKEDFLANMSHEIRTPLNSIVGFTELASERKGDKEQSDQLLIIKKSAEHLNHLVNDILDFSKLEAGKLDLEKIVFKPKEIVKEVIQFISVQVDKKEVKLSYSIQKDAPELLIGDPFRLRQILLNITSNAIKFTKKGEVNIKAEALPKTNENKILLKVTVSDSGIGIPEDKLNAVFSAFVQADTSTTRKYGGTGLGLTITKRLIELQNGNIEINSTVGKGTTVMISIPYTIGTSDQLIKPSKPFVNPERNIVKSVLIADDEEYNRKLLITILKKWGVECSEANNGEEVLKLMQNNNYDLILMDALMPLMSGVEATEQIRKTFKGNKSKIPIIALTAAVSDENIKRYMEVGMNDYLTKPFKEKDLYEKIISVVNHIKPSKEVKLNGSLKIKKDLKDTTKVNGKRFNLEELYSLSDGSEQFVSEMIQVFIRTTKDGIKKISESIEAKLWENVADEAHKIAAPCGHLQMMNMYSLLKKIEDNARSTNHIEEIPALLKKLEKEVDTLFPLLENEINDKAF